MTTTQFDVSRLRTDFFLGGVAFLVDELNRGASVASVKEKAILVFGADYCRDMLNRYDDMDTLLNHLECHKDALIQQLAANVMKANNWSQTDLSAAL